LRVQI